LTKCSSIPSWEVLLSFCTFHQLLAMVPGTYRGSGFLPIQECLNRDSSSPFEMFSLTTFLRSNNSKYLQEDVIANSLLTDRRMHLASFGRYPPWSFLLV
jgi:hypothetical protein